MTSPDFIAALNDRLGGIETKLDILIRLEERQSSMAQAHSQLLRRVESAEKKLNELQISQSSTNAKNGAMDYLVKAMHGAAFAVVIGVAVKFFAG